VHSSSAQTTVTVWCAQPLPDGVGAEWLSPTETLRAAGFRRAEDRRRFTTARALVRAVVGARHGVAPRAVDVRVEPQDEARPGKPFVPDGPSFSIAHAERWVLLAVLDSRGREVGVDVESVAPARDHLADLVSAVPPQERPPGGWSAESFTRSWVRREAVLKAVGTGLLAPRDDLVLTRADDEPGVLHSGGELPPPERLQVRDLHLPERGAGPSCLAAVALCAPNDGAPARLPFVAALAYGDDLLAQAGLAPP
jgi:4'-phosphopantetheinyl transferase